MYPKQAKPAFLLLLFIFICSSIYAAVEPKHEYEKPGYNPGHAYDGILPEESINLFTGGLQISQRDIRV
ncbi:hypothetical protein L0156_04640 [bacterium]|nr:hypothetical protein [bacterium]